MYICISCGTVPLDCPKILNLNIVKRKQRKRPDCLGRPITTLTKKLRDINRCVNKIFVTSALGHDVDLSMSYLIHSLSLVLIVLFLKLPY